MRNLDGRYMLINREYERLFNLRREDVVGLTDHDLFPAAVADEFRANDLAATRGGVPVQMEEVAPGEDGMHTYITVKFPLLDADGRVYAVCGISTDITDRKRAEEEVARLNAGLERRVLERTAELEASTRELDAFAYSVSHDLRAPLRALLGFSQMLLDDHGDRLNDEGVGYLRRLQQNASRMSQLIDDLLRLSRTTRAEISHQPIDLGQLAEAIFEELRAIDPDRIVKVTIDDHMAVFGDSRLIRLALQNLIANAWKFTSKHPDPQIAVGSGLHEGVPAFFVRDNGAGFDSRYAKRLFEPFQRLHDATDFEGAGIGLAIVQRVIQRHGGTLWAESMPGEGATFSFSLTTTADDYELEDRNAE
jgi:PAS domain S-box-containing protein